MVKAVDEQVLSGMADILGEQALVYGGLVELSRKKQQVLVEGGTREFEAILESEQALLWRAGKLEEKRLQLQERLASEISVSAEKLSVSRLIDLIDEPMADRYRKLQSEILTSLDELGKLNQLNTRLIQRSLKYINATLELLTRLGPGATYSPDGQPVARRLSSAVVNRKV